MRQFVAFFEKECMELIRSGKLLILGIVFIFFGIMNPAMAKLTPWMMEVASESLADSGLIVDKVNVDAMTSWTQYYKNISIVIVVFMVMFSGTLAVEYQKGTLINMVTKGLARWKIVVSKAAVMLILWTVLHWMSFFITYGYNAYYWDNGIADNVFFAAFCIYILGIWLISLLIFMSVVASSNIFTALFTGGIFGVCYFVGLLSKINEFLPTNLVSAGDMLNGAEKAGDYKAAIIVSIVLTVINIVGAVGLFNRKAL